MFYTRGSTVYLHAWTQHWNDVVYTWTTLNEHQQVITYAANLSWTMILTRIVLKETFVIDNAKSNIHNILMFKYLYNCNSFFSKQYIIFLFHTHSYTDIKWENISRIIIRIKLIVFSIICINNGKLNNISNGLCKQPIYNILYKLY